jgi:hypothetical protein
MRCKTILQVATGSVRFGPVSPSGFSSLNSAALVAAVSFSAAISDPVALDSRDAGVAEFSVAIEQEDALA